MNPLTKNNNPGGLKENGEFKRFDTPQEGYSALLNDLSIKMSGNSKSGITPDSTLYDFAKVWAPVSDKNNPEQYAANLANFTKKRPDTKLEEFRYNLSDLAQAIVKSEGYIEDTSQNQQKESQSAQTGNENKSWVRKAAEWAFPILEKKERTPMQTLGDVGLSALWFVPGLGAGAETALRGLGLGAKVARAVGMVGGGALTGYGADVASKLSQGQTGSGVLKPDLGTAIGAVTGGITSKLASKYSQKGVLEGIAKENNAVFGQTKKGANELAESFSKNKDPGRFLAERGVNLKKLVNPKTVAYETSDASQKMLSDAHSLNEILTEKLNKIPVSKPISELETELLSKVPKNYPERADIVKKEMQLLKQQFGDNPLVGDINQWKQRAWNLGKFDTAVPNDTRLTYRMIGNHLKTSVENLAEKGGLKRVGDFNELIGSHMDASDMLKLLNGTKAKGGRLGNLLRKTRLQGIGALAGSLSGTGPIGVLGGMIAGHYGEKALTSLIGKVEGSPIKSAILSRISKEEPEIVRQFEEFAKRTPEGLQGLKKQLAEHGIDILKETEERKPISLISVPKKEKMGLTRGLVNVGTARLAAQQ